MDCIEYLGSSHYREADMNPTLIHPTKCRYLVFLPVRNGGEYIRFAINSVLAQSRSDWLMVVLENASSDDTLAIVESYSDPRIIVIPVKSGLGIEQNWARVYQVLSQGEIQGQFATLIGHDDILYPSFLEAIETLYVRYPAVGLYQTSFDLIDQNDQYVRPCRPIPECETYIDFLATRGWGLRDSFGTGYVFRVDDYLRVGGIPNFPMLLFSDDLLFAYLAQEGGKVCTPEPHCAYRLHQASTSGSLSYKRSLAVVIALRKFLDHVRRDFPAYWNSPKGRAAIAALIAREVLIFKGPLLYWAFSLSGKEALNALKTIYDDLSGGCPPNRWIAINSVVQWVYKFIRIVFWVTVFFRDRLINRLD